jgi:predicted Ser/Thr protein kinase
MPDDISGTTIAGRYQVVEQIGRGGLGVVYRAIDRRLAKAVALKVLPKGILDGEEHQRLMAEAKILERLHCPNIVCIYDYGDSDNSTYLAMEYVEGRSLAEILSRTRKPLDILCALGILRQVGKALECIHQNGLVHRDIKPSNILISKQGKVLLADFGLAMEPGPQLTTIGTIVGTPAYMSPEQARGVAIDARSDIFSLAAVIYQSVTGRPPFEGLSIGVLLRNVVESHPRPPSELNPLVDYGLEAPLLKALAGDREQRFSSIRLFLEEVERSLPRFATAGGDAATLLSKLVTRPALDHQLLDLAEAEPRPPFAPRGFDFVSGGLGGDVVTGGPAVGFDNIFASPVGGSRAQKREAPEGVVPETPADQPSASIRPQHRGRWRWLATLGGFFRRGPQAGRSAGEAAHVPPKELEVKPPSSVNHVEETVADGQLVSVNTQPTTPQPSSKEPFDESPTIETFPYATGIYLAQLKEPTAVAWLTVLNGPFLYRAFRLADTFTIDNTLIDDATPADPSLSRRHAQIVLENGRFYIYDVESRQGTMVNGRPVQKQELKDGDEVRIGNVTMRFNANNQADLDEEAKGRLREFDSLWEELTQSVHHD